MTYNTEDLYVIVRHNYRDPPRCGCNVYLSKDEAEVVKDNILRMKSGLADSLFYEVMSLDDYHTLIQEE